MNHPLILFTGLVLASVGCADDPGLASVGDPIDQAQLPPRGATDLPTWIDAGYYQAWNCEPEAHAARSPSPHGRNRICSNDLLSAAAGAGPYPVGSAAVKEIFDSSGSVSLYAVYRKVEDGDGGDTWYWFEGTRDDVVANGPGDTTCTGCHSHAPRDFVFTAIAK